MKERLLKIFLALAFLSSVVGCSGPEAPVDVAHHERYGTVHHTGPVTVIDISVSYCEPAVGEKSGTGVCDRSITLEAPDHRVSNMGLCRTGQWPPVWHGMKADIYFKLHDYNGFDGGTEHDCAVIQYAEELK